MAYCKNVNIKVFGSNEIGRGLETINNGALYGSGQGVNEITLLSSIKTLHSDVNNEGNHLLTEYAAFEGYANSKIHTLNSVKNSNEIFNQRGQTLTSFDEVGLVAENVNISPDIKEG